MKSKVSPLALGGVLVVCVATLAFAGWLLLSSDGRSDSDANAASEDRDALAKHSGESAVPMAPKAAPRVADESARVAIADESHPPVLPQAEFELRTNGDKALADARTLLRRGEEVLGTARCDASGVVHFDASDGHAELIVLAKDIPAFTRDVSLSAGHHLIVLERGVTVSGRVRVAKEAPVADVELILTSDRPLIDESNWPESVRRALELGDRDKLRLATRTNAAGQFEFSGLGSPWSGKLEVGEAHELLATSGGIWAPGNDSIRLDDPIQGLVLDLAALTLARGRVVAAAGGAGVARASVSGFLAFEPGIGDDEGATAGFDGRAASDGTFALPIHRRGGFDANDMARGDAWPTLKSATLTLDAGAEIPRRRLELSGAQLPEGFDFGELVLERGASLQFIATDAQAKPLAGAIGRLDGERSDPTDESGRSTIVYAPGTGRPLSVSLDGYRDGRIDVPKDAPEALTVVLERTNRLTVIVRNPDNQPAVGIVVQLTGQRQAGGRGNRRNRVNEQRTDGKGQVMFSDLVPATPVSVTVRDAMGASVAERATTLAADEWATMELSISRPLLAFSGVVRDELGLALAEAGIEFTDMQNANRANVSARSDAEGHFEFSGLSNPTGLLRVRKTGFAPLSLPDFQIPPPGVIADIRLERGLRLTLRIVDPRGAPVRGDLRLELPGERPFQGRRASDNEWDFSNLPRYAMVAVGNVGSREYRQDVEPLNGNQDFVVPVQGGLEVTLRLSPALLQSKVRMSLRARDDRRVQPSQECLGETLQTRTFAPLKPGDYQLTVMQLVRDGERASWVGLGQVQKVTIAEGANTRVEISR